jgi:hypothetical protein
VRVVAELTGNALQELSINHATDTSDILGSYEQVDSNFRALSLVRRALQLVGKYLAYLRWVQKPQSFQSWPVEDGHHTPPLDRGIARSSESNFEHLGGPTNVDDLCDPGKD